MVFGSQLGGVCVKYVRVDDINLGGNRNGGSSASAIVIIGPGKGMREEEQSTEGGGEETWRVKNMHGSVVERSGGWRFNKNFGT